MITFTIVTITYNAADVVQRTLESVLVQDYPHVEHLIVDGASTDATIAIVEKYAKKNVVHRVECWSEPDKGIYDAMNKGLRKATGQYIVFLNAGDFYPNAGILTKIANQLENYEEGKLPAVAYGETDIVDGEGRFLCHRRLQAPQHLSWRSFRHGMLVCHQAFYARTDIARQESYDLQYRYSADVDWCIRIMKRAQQEGLALCNINNVLVNYTREGQTTIHHRASLKERFRVMAHHYGLLSTMLFHIWFAVRSFVKK